MRSKVFSIVVGWFWVIVSGPSRWLALVTDVDATTGRNLIDSMGVEVVVTEQRIRDVVPGDPLTYEEAVRRALAERKAALAEESDDA